MNVFKILPHLRQPLDTLLQGVQFRFHYSCSTTTTKTQILRRIVVHLQRVIRVRDKLVHIHTLTLHNNFISG